MQIYTLIIPSNKLVLINKEKNCYSIDYKSIALPTELQGQHRKAYIYSQIESQDSFWLFFYAQIIERIIEFYTNSIPQLPILFLYHFKKLSKIWVKRPIDYACNTVSGIV